MYVVAAEPIIRRNNEKFRSICRLISGGVWSHYLGAYRRRPARRGLRLPDCPVRRAAAAPPEAIYGRLGPPPTVPAAIAHRRRPPPRRLPPPRQRPHTAAPPPRQLQYCRRYGRLGRCGAARHRPGGYGAEPPRLLDALNYSETELDFDSDSWLCSICNLSPGKFPHSSFFPHTVFT